MPQKKTTRKAPASKGAKKAPAKQPSKTTKESANKSTQKDDVIAPIHSVMPFVLVIAAIFLLVALFFTTTSGILGKGLYAFMLGMFGGVGYATPVIILTLGLFWKKDAEEQRNLSRILLAVFFLLGLAAFVHSFSDLTREFNPQVLWEKGFDIKGGGVLGGLLGSCLYSMMGKPGLIIVSVAMSLIIGIFFFGGTPSAIIEYFARYISEKETKPKETKPEKAHVKKEKEPKVKKEPEIDEYIPSDDDIPPFDIDDNTPSVDPEIFERIKNEINATSFEEDKQDAKSSSAIDEDILNKHKGRVELEDVFNDYEDDLYDDLGEDTSDKPVIEAEVAPLIDDEQDDNEEELPEELSELIPAVEVKKEPKPYVFPPITLLPLDKKPNTEDVTDELRSNATKLVDTLASFKVRTKIIDISRGPTITRYELAPEEGVRVRQIANLVDDISLSLASSGIRIEAPIPGKAAVGIEVPNKVVATVYLRELIENPTFVNAKSKITVSLGMDVAGAPVFVDIAKMPHLLIAGATGMGKSVCINSMIVSLLYKANPDEVKLILIDPKKVEFNVYNGLPHLLIPVVSDPKKAAGALHWAVAEMERRFQLIENVGVRNITNFNEITKDDPTYDFMPHVVIVIDELADLMMTAPDEVEDSICRLAQKARAAGMHIIIGTQRPSVDVITGLIKANIPSRIACTVASQVDSRTILDTAGAEKLIGRGDMLYAPVGAAKPIRVQGAYVDEKEVEAVTEFIRLKSGETEYDNEVIEKIEKEAAKCGVKKGAGPALDGTDDDEDADPMLKNAIELAVDSGKISTSLIQRKLSLGYGRAAKLIDRMEKMGIVGAPEGNKPREVLISRAEFLEMTMNSNDE
ncbi:MAG: DNA translocase FtsK [Ruminococcaceae bacterium]|nr:DNA translocase FtsK [Oscillospiraceae bacterium]